MTHLCCSRDRQLCGVQVPIPQLCLQHLGYVRTSVALVRDAAPTRLPVTIPSSWPLSPQAPISPTNAILHKTLHPDLQVHPMDDVSWVQHIPQGLAHLPALPVPNHGMKEHLGAWRESAEELREPFPGGDFPGRCLYASGVRGVSKSGIGTTDNSTIGVRRENKI